MEWEAEVGGQLSLCDHLCDLESIILSSLSFLVCQEERSQSLLGGFVRSKCQNAQDSLVANVLWKQPREFGVQISVCKDGGLAPLFHVFLVQLKYYFSGEDCSLDQATMSISTSSMFC